MILSCKSFVGNRGQQLPFPKANQRWSKVAAKGHQSIMDTGCGSDLISKAKVEDQKLRKSKAKCPIQVQIANGDAKGMEVMPMNIAEFDEGVEPDVLPDISPLLSIGRRWVREGHHFVWLSGKRPCLITLSGKVVVLPVEDDIPYDISVDPRCQPVDPTRAMFIPCLLKRVRDVAGLQLRQNLRTMSQVK